MQLGHVHLKVRDLERSVDFYTRFFGLEVTERVGDRFVFLSGSDRHHELALQDVGPEAPTPPSRGVGLYHVALEARDAREFAEVYRGLTDAGVPVRPRDHGISWALYLNDPDGNGLEIYRDTRGEPGGRADWRGESRDLEPDRILEAARGG